MILKTFVRENNWLNRDYGIDFGWGNGYVIIPKEHPMNGVHYDDIPVEVHGGLTFSETGENCKRIFGIDDIDNDDWVVGFDTAHLNDSLRNWPKDKVERETYRLKRQLEKMVLPQ